MGESFSTINEKEWFKKYELEIKCPKCRSEEVTIDMEVNGLFVIALCNKCGYKK